jgi:hypothetical protein
MGEFVGGFYKRFGDVDAAHLTLKAVREIPRWATQAAPNIENMVVGLDGQTVPEFHRGG